MGKKSKLMLPKGPERIEYIRTRHRELIIEPRKKTGLEGSLDEENVDFFGEDAISDFGRPFEYEEMAGEYR